jgi:hypothetical protein
MEHTSTWWSFYAAKREANAANVGRAAAAYAGLTNQASRTTAAPPTVGRIPEAPPLGLPRGFWVAQGGRVISARTGRVLDGPSLDDAAIRAQVMASQLAPLYGWGSVKTPMADHRGAVVASAVRTSFEGGNLIRDALHAAARDHQAQVVRATVDATVRAALAGVRVRA